MLNLYIIHNYNSSISLGEVTQFKKIYICETMPPKVSKKFRFTYYLIGPLPEKTEYLKNRF